MCVCVCVCVLVCVCVGMCVCVCVLVCMLVRTDGLMDGRCDHAVRACPCVCTICVVVVICIYLYSHIPPPPPSHASAVAPDCKQLPSFVSTAVPRGLSWIGSLSLSLSLARARAARTVAHMPVTAEEREERRWPVLKDR